MTQSITSSVPTDTATESRALAVVEQSDVFNLGGLIDEQIEENESADPQALADAVFENIPADRYAEIVRRLLPERVRVRLRKLRVQQRTSSPSSRTDGSDRWEAVRDRQNAGALQILRWRIGLGDEDWKFFEDCTRQDVERIVAGYTRRAVEQADQAQRFKAVLAAMQEAKAERVGDVELDRLVTIFHA